MCVGAAAHSSHSPGNAAAERFPRRSGKRFAAENAIE
jgi:hypothetical protein